MNSTVKLYALLFGVIFCAPKIQLPRAEAQTNETHSAYPKIDLHRAFGKANARFLGLQNAKTGLFVTRNNRPQGTGDIVSWNLASNKKTQQISLSKWLWDFSLTLSPDGKFLVTGSDRMSPEFSDVKTHRTTVLSAANFTTVVTVETPNNEDVVGYLFDPNDNTHFLLKTGSLIPVPGENDFVFGHDRIDWLSLKTTKVTKKISYNPARGCSKILSSPNHNFLAAFFYSEAFAPYGDNDYLINKMERSAIVDILDAKTGKILWHLQGSEKQPVGDPLFFISPTRFISAGTVFDIQKRTAHHWSAVNDKSRCLATVPHHPDYALFLTPNGLQLRNWRKNKMLVSWPTLKESGRINFSPDSSLFSFKRGAIIQFWKFDSKWLK